MLDEVVKVYSTKVIGFIWRYILCGRIVMADSIRSLSVPKQSIHAKYTYTYINPITNRYQFQTQRHVIIFTLAIIFLKRFFDEQPSLNRFANEGICPRDYVMALSL